MDSVTWGESYSFNVLHENLPFLEELIQIRMLDLTFLTRRRKTLVQEGGAFIQDLLAPVLSSLGFLML